MSLPALTLVCFYQVVEHASVSRQHLALTFDVASGGVLLTDLQSGQFHHVVYFSLLLLAVGTNKACSSFIVCACGIFRGFSASKLDCGQQTALTPRWANEKDLSLLSHSTGHGTQLDECWIKPHVAKQLRLGSKFKLGASTRTYKVASIDVHKS